MWKLSEADEASLSIVLPVDTLPDPRKQPWILQILEVNTMNFCSFAKCPVLVQSEAGNENPEELLIAVPNTISSETVRLHGCKYGHISDKFRSTSFTSPAVNAAIPWPIRPTSKAGWSWPSHSSITPAPGLLRSSLDTRAVTPSSLLSTLIWTPGTPCTSQNLTLSPYCHSMFHQTKPSTLLPQQTPTLLSTLSLTLLPTPALKQSGPENSHHRNFSKQAIQVNKAFESATTARYSLPQAGTGE